MSWAIFLHLWVFCPESHWWPDSRDSSISDWLSGWSCIRRQSLWNPASINFSFLSFLLAQDQPESQFIHCFIPLNWVINGHQRRTLTSVNSPAQMVESILEWTMWVLFTVPISRTLALHIIQQSAYQLSQCVNEALKICNDFMVLLPFTDLDEKVVSLWHWILTI